MLEIYFQYLCIVFDPSSHFLEWKDLFFLFQIDFYYAISFKQQVLAVVQSPVSDWLIWENSCAFNIHGNASTVSPKTDCLEHV